MDNIGIDIVIYDDYSNIKQEQDVPLVIGFSQRPHYLPKDHPDFWRLYKIVSSKEVRFYEITYIDKRIGQDLGLPIIDIKEISEAEQARLQEQYRNGLEDPEVSTRSVTSITMSQANSFFNSMKALNCPVLLSNPCIPFQYAGNGCDARAHYMRLQFQSTFGGDCEKIFVWRATSTPLQATTNVSCCASWVWHVAPLVTVGSTKYVIDPGLFNTPVLSSVWINKVRGCVTPTVSYASATKPGNTYGYTVPTGTFSTNSSNMYSTLSAYSTMPAGCD